MLNNLRMAGNLPNQKSSESYDEQVKKIASKQDEYTDEYEGYGSLTEMIKHQDNLADSVAQQNQQNDDIAKVKAKMTEALNGASQKKQEESTNTSKSP